MFKIALQLVYLLFSAGTVSPSAPKENTQETLATSPASHQQLTDPHEEFPLILENSRKINIKRIRNHTSATLAVVYPGARLRVTKRGRSQSCPHGWLGRQGGGFICSEHLKPAPDKFPGPSPDDDPHLLAGMDAYEVVGRQGPKLFRSLKDLERRRAFITLQKTSTLIVKGKITHQNRSYFQTRSGWYVEDQGLEKLPPPIESLGIDIPRETVPPLGIVVAEGTETFREPNGTEPQGILARWSVIEMPASDGKEVGNPTMDGWVSTGPQTFIRDDKIALYRKAPRPTQLGKNERWLAVDLGEQLVHAYEGTRLVRLMPCSTGKRGNTAPGNYSIQWKRRAQTMRLRQGQIRVEDVQWVMYYNRKQGIAIHSAYWHHNFGTPVSHGCVNLPPLDARWVFEWTLPEILPEDSERFPAPGSPASRVVVFKN